MSEKAKIFLVDDHPMVRAGLAHILQGAGYAVAGEAGGLKEALAHPGLAQSRLVLLDLSLGAESGLDRLEELRARGPAVLVYSMHQESVLIRRALAGGAGGYVTKREAAKSLLEAVETVLSGALYLSPLAKAALREMPPSEGLSVQQQQLYRLLGRGFTNEEIASELGLSVRTVESYFARIMDKLGIDGMRELRRQAIRENGGPEEP